VFADVVLPLWDGRVVVKAGARADWALANIDSLPADQAATLAAIPTIGPGPYDRHFDLWAAYLSGEYKWTDHWTLLAGAAEAMVPPTPTELYAAGPVLAVVQNGLNVVQGNVLLNPEQARQLDLGFRADYETFRCGLSGFYSWIHNYITFAEVSPKTPPFQANTIAFVNTNRASLSGFESYLEWDATEWLTPFATLEYVEGRDYTRNFRGAALPGALPGSLSPQEPLPGIPPLESRVGLRLHDRGKSPRWGVEALARMVSGQHRFAESLGEVATPGFTIFNVRGYWRVNRTLVLTAGVENLGNRLYQEALDLRTGLGVFQPGIDSYFGAQVTY
jgi:outer membrane receptor protein involved in Fe transport